MILRNGKFSGKILRKIFHLTSLLLSGTEGLFLALYTPESTLILGFPLLDKRRLGQHISALISKRYAACAVPSYRLFIGSWFYDAFSESNDKVTSECWIGKDVQGSGRGLILVLSQNLPGGTKKTRKSHSGQPVSVSRFEPGTSRIRSVSVNRHVTVIQRVKLVLVFGVCHVTKLCVSGLQANVSILYSLRYHQRVKSVDLEAVVVPR
jgi:hypothetical protein